jgi:hypothetical protein
MLPERTPFFVSELVLNKQRVLFFGAYYQEDVLGDLERVTEHSQLHENRLGLHFSEVELKKII